VKLIKGDGCQQALGGSWEVEELRAVRLRLSCLAEMWISSDAEDAEVHTASRWIFVPTESTRFGESIPTSYETS
jgi:hypothetical protein